jgi:hypothetical protein
MRRRQFITLLGATAVPFAARAQSMPVVGILSGTDRDARNVNAILAGLKDSGFDEGRNVAIEFGVAQGHFDRLPALAQDMVRRPVAVIVAIQSITAPRAAKAATPTIPIVFSIGGDPVRLGLVASLNRPGGNVTGATFLVNTLSAKRLELLHALLPGVKIMGLLVNPKNPAAPSEAADVQEAARALGLRLQRRQSGGDRGGICGFRCPARRCGDLRGRCGVQRAPRPAGHARRAEQAADDVFLSRVRQRRRLDQLWRLRHRCVSARRRLCRPHRPPRRWVSRFRYRCWVAPTTSSSRSRLQRCRQASPRSSARLSTGTARAAFSVAVAVAQASQK